MSHRDDAVATAELVLHGLGGIQVIDASIMPLLVGGNTKVAGPASFRTRRPPASGLLCRR